MDEYPAPDTVSASSHEAPVAVIDLRRVSKTYPGGKALDDVHLTVMPGEIRALLGENGSGKSTLIKTLAGYHLPDPGAIAFTSGHQFDLGSAHAARESGIRFLHQDLGLVEQLTICDNLALGSPYEGRLWVGRRREHAAAEELLEKFALSLDVGAPVSTLSPAQKTAVAIARMLREGTPKLVVLDEPTASLSASEVEVLFDVVLSLRSHGCAVLFVTHRLQEVFDIADTVTILRDGHLVGDHLVASLDEGRLVELLVGGSVAEIFPTPPPVGSRVTFSVEGMSGGTVKGVSLRVHQGEIVGLAGIVGSGREEILQLVFGSRPSSAGRIRLGETESWWRPSVAAGIANGIAFSPADRVKSGALGFMSVRENMTLVKPPVSRWLRWLSNRTERREVSSWLERFDIRPRDPDRPMSSLSGGNQQRVILARWLRLAPRVMLLEEPTSGVDILAKSEIYRILATAASSGTAVLVASSDAEELASICDRVIVLRDGSVEAELSGPDLSIESVIQHSISTTRHAS
jgi:ribose transport system ATP-binding protein